jgi:hypothetical protein
MSPEERQRRFQERMAAMSPEEREAFMQRMRERGFDPSTPGGGRGGTNRSESSTAQRGAPGRGAAAGATGTGAAPRVTAETIDQLFGPLPTQESVGRAWLYINNQLKMVRLRLGITDGTYTELLSGDLQPGQELVTQVVTPEMAAAGASNANTSRSPLMPGFGRGPGGGRPGGGGR